MTLVTVGVAVQPRRVGDFDAAQRELGQQYANGGGDYPEAMDNYDLVPSGLIKLIKQGFNVGVDHSGTSIGQPTNFFVGAALNLVPADMETEIKNLHRKIKAGADFFLMPSLFEPLGEGATG